jgi:hypothetical protein
MGQTTKIEWSSHTFSPWYGCRVPDPMRQAYGNRAYTGSAELDVSKSFGMFDIAGISGILVLVAEGRPTGSNKQ